MANKVVTLENNDGDSLYPATRYDCVIDSNGNVLPSQFSHIPLYSIESNTGHGALPYYTKNESDAQTQALSNRIGNVTNPNLLINGDFQVNQRGLTTYTEIKKYTVDRWVQREHGTVEILNGGIRVNCTETGQVGINQSLETFTKLFGKTLTLSMKVNAISGSNWILRATSANNSYWHTHPIAEKTSISTIGLHSVTFDFDASSMSNYTLFNIGIFGECSQGDYIEIEYIKLEVGSVATPFSPRPYGQELLDCMRYYQKIDDLRLVSSMLQSNQIQYSLPLQIPIRGYDQTASPVLPTVGFGSLTVQSISGTDQTGFTFSIAFGTTYMLVIKASKSGHGLTPVSSMTMRGSPITPLTIDAEIY